MSKTADFIAEQQSVQETSRVPTKRKIHPNSLKNLVAPWKPGQPGNPRGKNGRDEARELARAIFENNKEAAYKALAKALLKGNAYVFKELAERAYGKLKETKEITHKYEEIADGDLQSRIDAILGDLGLAAEVNAAGRAEGTESRAGKTNGAAKDTAVLS